MNMPTHMARKPAQAAAGDGFGVLSPVMPIGPSRRGFRLHPAVGGPVEPEPIHRAEVGIAGTQCPTAKSFLPQRSLPRISHSARVPKSTWPERFCSSAP